MCLPLAALGIGSAIVSAIGTGAQVVGGLNAAAAAEKEGRANKAIADAAAEDAIARGKTEAGRARMAGGQVVGAQRAAFGASGVDVGTGSPAQLQEATRALSEIDVGTIKANAAREAWGYKMQGKNIMAKAAAYADESRWRAAGSLLGGVSNVASSVYGIGKERGWK